MTIMVTGANGRLAKELVPRLKEYDEVCALTRAELDVTNKGHVEEMLKKWNPHCIFHCAAYTDVEACEQEYEKAFEINSFGTLNIAKAAQKCLADLVYISTNSILDGIKASPYLEGDKPNRVNIYTESKRLGERFVQLIHPKSYIIRTSWLYGSSYPTVVNAIIEKAKKKEAIQVSNSEFGSPTSIKDFVEALTLIPKQSYGIYHLSNEGSCSLYGLAKQIYQEAGVDPALVSPISSGQNKCLEEKPDCSALGKGIDFHMRSWQEALKEYVQAVLYKSI
ncbi:MAG TPA: dTDP-4-dehydrorhamnose reductase [Bacillus sp. (in: firmicutes)]|nr:dTDP-4-dehydrorhamnose reductase [Bacillus sp. (in: firmicutes)]